MPKLVRKSESGMLVRFLSRNLEESSLWSWIRGYDSSLEFMDTILGSSRHSQNTENMDPDMDLEMIWKTSRHIVSVFPPPGIEETDIFGWDNLLWPPTVHPATEFSDYFALNLLKMACFNGFFRYVSCKSMGGWMPSIYHHSSPFFALKIPRVFPTFQVDNLHKDDEVIFGSVRRDKLNDDFLLKMMQLFSWN